MFPCIQRANTKEYDDNYDEVFGMTSGVKKAYLSGKDACAAARKVKDNPYRGYPASSKKDELVQAWDLGFYEVESEKGSEIVAE